MEAERTTNATGLRDTPVAYLGEGIAEADNLTTDNSEFLDQLAELSSDRARGALCQAAFEVGVLVWSQVKNSGVLPDLQAEVDRLEEAVSRATHTAVSHVQTEVGRISSPDDGVLATAVAREVEKLRSSIDAAFDEDDRTSAIARIEVTVAEATKRIAADNRAEIQKLLDASAPDSPLERLRTSIARDVNDPLKDFAETLSTVQSFLDTHEQLRQERAKGTDQGREFEDLVGSALARITASTEDEFEATGTTTGVLPSSKVGDFVMTVHTGGPTRPRVVFEAKNSSRTMPKTKTELDEASENREADVAVMVFADEAQSPAKAPLVRIARFRYAVVHHPDDSSDLALQVAYQLACADARAIAASVDDHDLDVELIAAKTKEAQELLRRVSQVKRGLTSAQSGLDSARAALDDMKSRISSTLEEISTLVQGDT